MQTMTFYFIGSAKNSVIEVGMRPSAIYHGSGIGNLKIVAHNIPAKNENEVDQVEIIVRGEEEQVIAFYNYVKSTDIRRHKKGPIPKVSKLEVYDGEEPDWGYCITSTIHEQLYKGFEILDRAEKTTQNLVMAVQNLVMTTAENRREDKEMAEKNRRDDKEMAEKNRRDDKEMAEKNRREDKEMAEKNRREDREWAEKNRREDKEMAEKNRREDKEGRNEILSRMDMHMRRSDEKFEKLFTTQAEILTEVKRQGRELRN